MNEIIFILLYRHKNL